MKGIYVIKEKNGDPVYVGKSLNIYGRWSGHIDNYPYEKYDYEVLELVEGDMQHREQYWIDEMNTLLNGDNKKNAVRTVEHRMKYKEELPPILNGAYRKHRILAYAKTFEGETCNVCGDPTTRYLTWYPLDKKIRSGFYRHGRNTKQRLEAIRLIEECRPVCQNCVVDREWGEERGPF